MPAGLELTEPLPTTVTESGQTLSLKSARTVVCAVIVTTQVPVPEQVLPIQPTKSELGALVAVSVTMPPSA